MELLRLSYDSTIKNEKGGEHCKYTKLHEATE